MGPSLTTLKQYRGGVFNHPRQQSSGLSDQPSLQRPTTFIPKHIIQTSPNFSSFYGVAIHLFNNLPHSSVVSTSIACSWTASYQMTITNLFTYPLILLHNHYNSQVEGVTMPPSVAPTTFFSLFLLYSYSSSINVGLVTSGLYNCLQNAYCHKRILIVLWSSLLPLMSSTPLYLTLSSFRLWILSLRTAR